MWPFNANRKNAIHAQRPTARRLRLEALEDRLLLSANITEVEPNNIKSQATVFTVPDDGIVQLQGTSLNKDDKDFFRFTAAQAGPVNLAVQAVTGPFAKLEFKDNLGNQLLETQPNDGINGGTVNLVAGRTYFVRLRSPNSSPAGYLVDMTFGGSGGGGGGGSGPVFNESEDNNSKSLADAFALNADGVAQLVGTSDNHDDKDFFVFTAQSSGTLNVVVSSTNGSFAQIEIKDRFGNSIFETEPNDGINSGSVQVLEGMTYFVRLRATGDSPAAYDVDLTLS
jgi:uncharacterized protein YdeI (BOF family)